MNQSLSEIERELSGQWKQASGKGQPKFKRAKWVNDGKHREAHRILVWEYRNEVHHFVQECVLNTGMNHVALTDKLHWTFMKVGFSFFNFCLHFSYQHIFTRNNNVSLCHFPTCTLSTLVIFAFYTLWE